MCCPNHFTFPPMCAKATGLRSSRPAPIPTPLPPASTAFIPRPSSRSRTGCDRQVRPVTPFTLIPGTMPLIVSMPHVATELPSDVAARMTDAGRGVPDTDWHIDRLYDFAAGLGASLIRPLWSRYLIDLNRAPDGRALYPGASNTELCPTTTFDDRPIWQDGEAPTEREIADRRERFWRPYADALTAELHRVKERHGLALLFDAHSIRSRVPRFFSGRLPDLNLGTGGGVTAAPDLVQRLDAIAKAASG